jgi:hypothetical protein
MVAQKPTGIRDPSHPIPDDIAEMVRNMNDAEQANLTRQHKLAKLGRPTKEERLELTKIEGAASNKRAFNSDQLKTIRDLSKRKSDRISAELKTYADADSGEVLPYPPFPFPHSFWWVNTEWWGSGGWFQIFSDPQGGVHFKGYVSEGDGELLTASFGLNSLFELQAWRIPESPSGQWLSTPNIGVAGTLFGHTHLWESSIFEPNWSKCWIHRNQTIFQSAFGYEPVRGKNEAVETLINEEGADHTMWAFLPGSQTMNPVVANSVSTTLSLWVRLSIYFDIQVINGTVSLSPEVVLRTPEWRLRAF